MADPDPNAPDPSDSAPPAPVTDPTPDPGQLGDGGKRALDAERKRASDAEKALKAANKELDELRSTTMTEHEKALAQARADARKEALTEGNARLLAAEIRSVAAGKLANPADAIHFLDHDGLLGEDGTPDSKAIEQAISNLVTEKPYLANAGPRDPDFGARPPAALPQGSSMDDFIRKAAGR